MPSRIEAKNGPVMLMFLCTTLIVWQDPIMNWAPYAVYNPQLWHLPNDWLLVRLSPTVEPFVVMAHDLVRPCDGVLDRCAVTAVRRPRRELCDPVDTDRDGRVRIYRAMMAELAALGFRAPRADEDVGDYVRALEETRDTTDLPEASGEAIAREFERYLKRRTEDT